VDAMLQAAVMKSDKDNIKLSVVEERHVAAQKYPKALQSRTADKMICLPNSATE